jgi:hypothetical protein
VLVQVIRDRVEPAAGPANVRNAPLATVGPKKVARREGPLPDSCAATKSGQFRDCGSGIQLIEQRLRFLQIERVEAFGKPAEDRSEKLASLIPLTLIAPEPRHAHRCA